MRTGKSQKEHQSDLQLEISLIGSVEPKQSASPYGHPFERDGGESEDEGLHPRCHFKSEAFALKDAEKKPVVVVQKDHDAHENCVRLHEGAWQVAPSEIVVHAVESALRTAPHVVELHHFLVAHLGVVCQDAPIDVFSVEQI